MGKTFEPLDTIIRESGMRFDYVAKKMGVTPNQFYKIRINPKNMSADKVEKLANVLDIMPSKIFNVIVDKNNTSEHAS